MKRMSVAAIAQVKTNLKLKLVQRRGIQIDKSARLNGLPRIKLADGSRVVIGPRVVLNSRWDSNDISCPYPTTLITTDSQAEILIGEDTGISSTVISARDSVQIGARVLIGANCLITDSDHHPANLPNVSERRYAKVRSSDTAGVVLENDVFLGTGTIVLKGVHIGRGTVVAAGSVVVNDLPSMSICAGNPCKPLREL